MSFPQHGFSAADAPDCRGSWLFRAARRSDLPPQLTLGFCWAGFAHSVPGEASNAAAMQLIEILSQTFSPGRRARDFRV